MQSHPRPFPAQSPVDVAVSEDVAVPPPIAARILGLSHKTLANWRVQGIGPAFVKSPGLRGAVRYQIAALKAWQQEHVRRSTSDEGGRNV